MFKKYLGQVLASVVATTLVGKIALALPLPSTGTCDPTKQSCVTPPPPPFGGATQCLPSRAGATCDGSGPATQGSGSGTNVGAGNPINIMTGNKYQREVDMPALPGVLGLEIVRHYNSAYSRPNHSNNIIGRGWKLSYETELYALNGTIQIVQADGTRLIFDRDSNDPSHCTSANPSDGTVRVIKTAHGDEYAWTWIDGRLLSFSPQGKLVQIAMPTGEFVSMQYDRKGLLLKVTDPQGRTLHLHYLDHERAGAGDRFHGVQYIESPMGHYTFDYGSPLAKGATLDKAKLLANLIKVGFGANPTSRIYHYEDPRYPTLLTGISVESTGVDGRPARQRIASYAYDADGRGVLTVTGMPARLQAGPDGKTLQPPILVAGTGIEQVTLDTSVAGRTVISNSLGQKTVYRHAIIAGQFRLLEVHGAGCASCGEANVRYSYDETGRLTGTVWLSVNGEPIYGRKTEFDGSGRVVKQTRISYRNGKQTGAQWMVRYEYEAANPRPILIAHPSVVPGQEAQSRITYNGNSQVLTVTESGWMPAIDGLGQATPIARTMTYRYSAINGRSLLTDIDGPLPNGKSGGPADSDITHLEWDSKGNVVVATIAPGNLRSQVQYDEVGRMSAVASADGRKTSFSYNASNQLVGTTSDGVTQATQYDAQGRVVEGIGEGTQYKAKFRFGFDKAGRNIWTASQLGILSRNRYDVEGNLLESSMQSASFKQTQHYAYDAHGRLVAATDAVGGTRRIYWNAQGLPAVLTDPLGRERYYRYDAMGNLAQVIEAANTALAQMQETGVRFEHDWLGQTELVTAPNGASTRYIRDDFGRTIAIISADSGTVTRSYDAAGRLVGSSDANGNHASYLYDVAGRIVQQTVTDAKATDVTRKQLLTRWKYDAGRLVAIDHPEQAERYEYNDKGLLSSKTVILNLFGGMQSSSVTRYRYDKLGQVESTSLPDGSTVEYKRNSQNQVVALERSRIQTPWLRWLLPSQVIVHDLQRDLVGLARATYGNGIQAEFQRSKEGILARIVYRRPNSSAANGVQSAALESILGIASAHAAEIDKSSHAGSTATDAVRLALPGALGLARDRAALLDHRYLWDLQGNLLHMQGSERISDYAYDAQDRLIATGTTSAANPGVASYARYFHDGAGNRLLAQEDVTDQTDTETHTIKTAYSAASNRWEGVGGVRTAIYDPNGQPGKIGEREFVWNALGQLVEVRQENRTVSSYRYNHMGERTGKSTKKGRTYYLYEGRKLTAELNGSGRIIRQYIYLADQPVAVIDYPVAAAPSPERSRFAQIVADLGAAFRAWFSGGETIVYLHNNHLGATELITDAGGRAVWQVAYGPYGHIVKKTLARSVSSADGRISFQFNLRLPGQYEDEETGLYYNDHRYYDPRRGQYLTPDPLGLRGGINAYAYAAGNPVKYIDPSGLILFAFDGTNNSNPAPDKDQLSNVWKFADAYIDG